MDNRWYLITTHAGETTALKRKTQRRLEALGIVGVNLPNITIQADPSALEERAMRHALIAPDWIAFLSGTSVDHLFAQYLPSPQTKLAAIGAASARALEQHNRPCDLVAPPPYSSASLASALLAAIVEASRAEETSVVIACGHDGVRDLAESLMSHGVRTTEVRLYRRVPFAPSPTVQEQVEQTIKRATGAAICFNSITSARQCQAMMPQLTSLPALVPSTRIKQAVSALGWDRVYPAAGPSDQEMVDCYCSVFGIATNKPSGSTLV